MRGSRLFSRLIISAAALFTPSFMAGCTSTTQTQYFEVVGPHDPVTGHAQRTFYRMTVKGNSSFLGKYNLSAAYVSSDTVDTLNGQIPTIPVADRSKDSSDAFESIRITYLDELKRHAQAVEDYADLPALHPSDPTAPPSGKDKQVAGTPDNQPQTKPPAKTAEANTQKSNVDANTPYQTNKQDQSYKPSSPKPQPTEIDTYAVQIARDAWFASLSDSDITSMGKTKTTNPFQFRKLVFVVSATNINLNLKDYDNQINSAMEQATTLAEYIKTTKKASSGSTKTTGSP